MKNENGLIVFRSAHFDLSLKRALALLLHHRLLHRRFLMHHLSGPHNALGHLAAVAAVHRLTVEVNGNRIGLGLLHGKRHFADGASHRLSHHLFLALGKSARSHNRTESNHSTKFE